MINIRAVTFFGDNLAQLHSASVDLNILNLKIRTKRIVLGDANLAQEASNLFWGVSVSLEPKDASNLLPELIKNDKIFISFPNKTGEVFFPDVNLISKAILDASKLSADSNFRIGTSFGNLNNNPFFPYTYSDSQTCSFSVGLEYVNFILNIIQNNKRMAPQELAELIESECINIICKISDRCIEIEKETGLVFNGIDISLAPYPYPLEEQSVGRLVEEIGTMWRSRGELPFQFGNIGTNFINSYLTSILTNIKSKIPRAVGFNGVMYSLLEDSILSQGYANRNFDINQLLMLSSTCGCGIDMVPLVGDIEPKDISAIILDIYATSKRLSKPLGVRVLPMKGLIDGSMTHFKHEYLSNTKVWQYQSNLGMPGVPNGFNQKISLSSKSNY